MNGEGNWLQRLRIVELSSIIQAAGVIIQILLIIITSEQIINFFELNFSVLIYSFLIFVLLVLTIVIWMKLGNRIRRFVTDHRPEWIKILIAGMFILILLLILNIFGIFPPPPPQPSLDPSGKMGDINDITIIRMPDLDRFVYYARGTAPHEWDWKYMDNHSLNTDPAQFGGVMYLNPPNNMGISPGTDLRPYHRSISWEARSTGENCTVEFLMGVNHWRWDNGVKTFDLKYPDSLPRKSFGFKTLTSDWRKFSGDLSGLPDDNFSNVIGLFGWVIPWGSNNISINENRTGSQNPKTFTIEIRNIQYHR